MSGNYASVNRANSGTLTLPQTKILVSYSNPSPRLENFVLYRAHPHISTDCAAAHCADSGARAVSFSSEHMSALNARRNSTLRHSSPLYSLLGARRAIASRSGRCHDQPNFDGLPRGKILLISDSWSGQRGERYSNFLRKSNVESLAIPPRATGDLQLLDVGFNRQWKILIKRVTERARLDMIDRIIDRKGVINLQSLMFNQLSAPVYRDLIKYAWHSADRSFNRSELHRFPPLNVNAVKFASTGRHHQCGVHGCKNTGFIRCAHCGRHLCLHHFLIRTCVHHEPAQNIPEFVRSIALSYEMEDDNALLDIDID